MFVALALVLTRVTIPFGVNSLYFWEIPIVIALLLRGFKFGFTVATISVFAQALIFPRSLGLLFPVWNLIAMSTTLIAIALTKWLFDHRASVNPQTKNSEKTLVMCFVAATLAIRVGVMPFVDFFMYKFMLPIVIGRAYTDEYIWGLMSFMVVYNIVLTLYTVPASYTIAKKVNHNLKMGTSLL